MSNKIALWLNQSINERKRIWLGNQKDLRKSIDDTFLRLRPDTTIGSVILRRSFFAQPIIFGFVSEYSFYLSCFLISWWCLKAIYLFRDSYIHVALGIFDLIMARLIIFMLMPLKSSYDRELYIQMTYEYQALELNKLIRGKKLSKEPWICSTPIISAMYILK